MDNCVKTIFPRVCLTLAILLPSATTVAMEALPTQPVIPKDNPMTPDKIALGKQLFMDPRLSVDGTVSCNSCHNVMSNGTDSRAVSVGVHGQKGGRSAPTVWNAAFLSAQFWDGRAATLEDQAKGPILNPIEMGMPDAKTVEQRLKAIPGYQKQFAKVFGGSEPITYDNIAKAIATYERTLITPDSVFDQYMRGDKTALSKSAQRGMKLVQSVGCTTCHSGPMFAGPTTLTAGQGFYQKFPVFAGSKYDAAYSLLKDEGRATVTKKMEDKNMWRVPTWRNVVLTAPYFHDGSVKTLDEAVRVMAKTQLNKDLQDDQVRDIVAFLDSLTGKFPVQTLPMLPDAPNNALLVSEAGEVKQ